jgi:hypothetical protein
VIKLSRHVKNNMRFYKISKNDIQKTVELPDIVEKEGRKMIALKTFERRFSGYPLKVVYEEIVDQLFVITAYPLKKKMWR